MFNLSQEQLFKWFLSSFFWGIALGLFYEAIRAFKMICGVRYNHTGDENKSTVRKIFEYGITFVTDLFFWIVAGVLSVLLIYQMGGGVFRGMTYLGLLAGFCLYYFTLGKYLLHLNEKVVLWMKRICIKAARLLLCPIKKIFCVFNALYRLTIGRILGKIKERINRHRKERLKSVEADLSVKEIVDGREEFVYVDGKRAYKKSGRISFDTVKK